VIRRPAGFRRRLRPGGARLSALSIALALVVATLSGCGHSAAPAPSSAQAQRAALSAYLKQVEPIRLAVNRLLNGADPILSANHEKTITPQQASLRMGALERRFAGYTVDVTAVQPTTPQLRSLHAIYAHISSSRTPISARSSRGLWRATLTISPTPSQNRVPPSFSGARALKFSPARRA
jgi:hypothetical protein